jgi:serine/threonine-protein kinase
MSSAHSDRNLLFGILALQMDFISRDALIRAMHAWVLEKAKPLGQVLLEQGALSAEARGGLERLVELHVGAHGGQPERSLAALRAPQTVRRELEQIADPELHASLAHVPAAPLGQGAPDTRQDGAPSSDSLSEGDTYRTPSYYSVGSLTSAGLRFRVLRPHAKGGLGQVSVALDEELHREVALKEIQEQYADHPHSRARFLLEAEVTGGLEHPGVVPVYGLGCHADGRPFYAMRLIHGVSLGEAIKQFHSAEVPGRDAGERGLALRGLLRRFVDVCNAVAYAHSRGVLHRDLKPANVMLGPFGETLVVDWGLAKATGEAAAEDGSPQGPLRPASAGGSAPTQAGAAIGTPAYMSPEQAAGRLDELGPASDVYSLGATLYHLLTGRAPFTASDVGEALRAVQRGDFPPPRQVKPAVPAALAAVCLKAMAPRPQGRYGSAKALAADVERWLADEPLDAYREPLPARLGRWSRRHRASVMSAAAALAVLALSLGVLAAVLSGHNRALAAANGREREAKDRESSAKEKARENFRLARQAVKDYCVKISLDPRLKQADFTGLRKELLATAVEFHQKFKDQEGDDPEVRAERAQAYFELAYIAKETGAPEEALGHYHQALALWVPLVEAHPDNRDYRWGLSATYNDLAGLYEDVGRPAEAEGAYRKALTLKQELADSDPSDEAAQRNLGMTHGNLALWLAGRRQFPEAEEHYGKALATWQALAGAHPGNARYLRNLADIRHKLSYLYSQTRRRDEALQGYQQALALRQRLHQEHRDNPEYQEDLGWSHWNLGYFYREAGEDGKAEEAFRQAVAARQAVADARPGRPGDQQVLAAALNALGMACMENGKTQEAVEAQRRAVAAMERLSKLYPMNLSNAVGLGGYCCNLGLRLHRHGEPQAALEWFDKAQATLEDVRRRDPEGQEGRDSLRNTHANRAIALLDLGRDAQALAELDRALTLPAPDGHPGWLDASRALALARLGKYKEAVPLAEQVAGRPDTPAFDLCRAAGALSRASAQARRDGQRAEPQRQELAEKYAAGAVALLRQAQAKGHFKKPRNVSDLEKDKDLGPLRQRLDFQKLLAELGKKPGS